LFDLIIKHTYFSILQKLTISWKLSITGPDRFVLGLNQDAKWWSTKLMALLGA